MYGYGFPWYNMTLLVLFCSHCKRVDVYCTHLHWVAGVRVGSVTVIGTGIAIGIEKSTGVDLNGVGLVKGIETEGIGTDPAAGNDAGLAAGSAVDLAAEIGTDLGAETGVGPAAKKGTDPAAKTGTDPAAKTGIDPAAGRETGTDLVVVITSLCTSIWHVR